MSFFFRLFFELTHGPSLKKSGERTAKSLFNRYIYRTGEIRGDEW